MTTEDRLYLETQTKARTIQVRHRRTCCGMRVSFADIFHLRIPAIRRRLLSQSEIGLPLRRISLILTTCRGGSLLRQDKYAEGGIENALFDAPGRGRNAEITDDEKPGIQAIATTSGDLSPDKNHSTFSRDYEYKRLRTISLLAGIDLQTGEAIPLVSETHNSRDYIEFLKPLDTRYPEKDKIRLVLDNLKVHTSEETRKYLASVPGRFEFVFPPKHGSWLNLVEGFFSKLTRQSLHGIRVKTKEELIQRIYKYFEEVNEDPVVCHWKYKLEEIDPDEQVQVATLPLKQSS